MNRLAIFISGPFRFLDKVINQLDKKLEHTNREFDFFIHIWKDDQSSKKRGDSKLDVDLLNHPKIKAFIYANPYTSDDFEIYTGKNPHMKSHSPINAMCGMFCAITSLYDSFKKLPDRDKYSHILRLRTDVSFVTQNIIPGEIKDNTAYVSSNPILSNGEVSDHSMLCDISTFEKLWTYKDFPSFIEEYRRVYFNPEFLLKKRVKESKLHTVDYWRRYIDYNIVYSKAMKSDPAIIKSLSTPADLFDQELLEEDIQLLKMHYENVKDRANEFSLKRLIVKSIKSNKMLSNFYDKKKKI